MAGLRYKSDEEVRKGDRVLFHGKPGEIEFVATTHGSKETDWYVNEFGGGIMILEPEFFGRAFIRADQLARAEDLAFCSRAEE